MIDLDNFESLKNMDSKGQLNWMTKWPDMISEGFSTGAKLKIDKNITIKGKPLIYDKSFNQIGICGMGGSGISGEFIQNYLQEVDFHIPISVIRGYKLPKHFTKESFILIVSYSGNTREALFCLYEALKRNIPVVLISSGGFCVDFSEKVHLPHVVLPKGFEPRAAFPILFGAIAGVLFSVFHELFFLENDIYGLQELLGKHNTLYEPKIPLKSNIAKQLANELLNVVPIYISEYPCLGMRMKGQMNENSKKLGFYDIFPEMMHNTTQSWKDEKLSELPFQIVRVIVNKDTEMSDKTSYGLLLAKYKSNLRIHDINFANEGDSLLHRLFLATYLVDYASIYLAFLRNYDPSFIDIVVGMKDKFEPELEAKFNIRAALHQLV